MAFIYAVIPNVPEKLFRGAFLLCGPWKDEYATKGGVRMACCICEAYVVIAKENEQNVKEFGLKPICNPCFAIGELLGMESQIGGFLLGDLISPEKWNARKKPV